MPGRLPSSAGGFHSPTLSRSRNAGYGSTTMSARGRRPNQAGIAALARSTAARAASSIALRERNVKAGSLRNRASSVPTSRVRNDRPAMARIRPSSAATVAIPSRCSESGDRSSPVVARMLAR